MPRQLFEEELAALDRAAPDMDHFTRHFQKLRRKYPNQHVAIREGKVVAHHTSLEFLFSALEDDGIDAEDVVIEFVPDKDAALVL